MCLITLFNNDNVIKISIDKNDIHKLPKSITAKTIIIDLCGAKWCGDIKLNCSLCELFGNINTAKITGKINTIETHGVININKLKKLLLTKPNDLYLINITGSTNISQYKCKMVDCYSLSYSQLKLFTAEYYEVSFLKLSAPQLIPALNYNCKIFKFEINGEFYRAIRIINKLKILYTAIYLSLRRRMPRCIINIIAGYVVI